MTVLTLEDIQTWLIENEEYQELNCEEVTPESYQIYFMYQLFDELLGYYQYKDECDKALTELRSILSSDFAKLSEWVKYYTLLGSQDLLMFEIDYFDWKEAVNNDRIKIHEGLYTEKRPFVSILCFCKVFQYLYWDNYIHKIKPAEIEKIKIKPELKNILQNFF